MINPAINQNEDIKIFNEKYEKLEANHDIGEEFIIVKDALVFNFDNIIDIKMQNEYENIINLELSDIFTDNDFVDFYISDIFTENISKPNNADTSLKNEIHKNNHENQEEQFFVKNDITFNQEDDFVDITF